MAESCNRWLLTYNSAVFPVRFQKGFAVNRPRPVNLDLGTIRLPITAYVSILHRISGVFLLVAVGFLLYLFDLSMRSEAGFERTKALLDGSLFKLVTWAVLVGLAYHVVAGVRHLIMDLGIGESLEGGVRGARLVFVVFVILLLLAGAWIW